MSFGDHLEELRSRILRVVLATALGFVVALIFQDELLEMITGPHRKAMETVGVRIELSHVTKELETAIEKLGEVPAFAGAALARENREQDEWQTHWAEIQAALVADESVSESVRAAFRVLGAGVVKGESAAFAVTRFEDLERQLEFIGSGVDDLASRSFLQSDSDFDPVRQAIARAQAVLTQWGEAAEEQPEQVAQTSAADAAAVVQSLDVAESEVGRARDRVTRFATGEGSSQRLHFFSYPESFFAHLKVCALAALLLGIPWGTIEIWRFIAAGLYPRERKAIRPFLPLSLLGTAVGASFAYFVLIPVGLTYLGGYGSGENFEASFRLKDYLSLVMTLMLGMALVFQLPLVMVFLARAGMASAEFYRRYRKFSIVGALLVGSMLTPPDVVTQLLMAGPLVLLYETGILATVFFLKRAEAAKSSTKP